MNPSHDVSAGGLIRGAYGLLKAHPLPLLVPLVVLGVLGSGDNRDPTYRWTPGEDPLVVLPFYALLGLVALAIFVVLFFLYAWAWLVTTRGAFAILKGEPAPTLGALARETQPLLLRGAGTFLLWFLAVIVGFLLLVVPGFIVLAGLFPLAAVIVAEGKGGVDALRRAWDLSRGHRGALFLVLLAGFGLSIAAGILLAWIPLVGNILAGAASGAVGAGLAVAGALYYERLHHHPEPHPPAPMASVPPA